jgi:hypothetical protein
MRETVARAKRSSHYGPRLGDVRIESLADLTRLPLTTKEDVRAASSIRGPVLSFFIRGIATLSVGYLDFQHGRLFHHRVAFVQRSQATSLAARARNVLGPTQFRLQPALGQCSLDPRLRRSTLRDTGPEFGIDHYSFCPDV